MANSGKENDAVEGMKIVAARQVFSRPKTITNPTVVLERLDDAVVEFYLRQMYGCYSQNWKGFKGGYNFRRTTHPSEPYYSCDNYIYNSLNQQQYYCDPPCRPYNTQFNHQPPSYQYDNREYSRQILRPRRNQRYNGDRRDYCYQRQDDPWRNLPPATRQHRPSRNPKRNWEVLSEASCSTDEEGNGKSPLSDKTSVGLLPTPENCETNSSPFPLPKNCRRKSPDNDGSTPLQPLSKNCKTNPGEMDVSSPLLPLPTNCRTISMEKGDSSPSLPLPENCGTKSPEKDVSTPVLPMPNITHCSTSTHKHDILNVIEVDNSDSGHTDCNVESLTNQDEENVPDLPFTEGDESSLGFQENGLSFGKCQAYGEDVDFVQEDEICREITDEPDNATTMLASTSIVCDTSLHECDHSQSDPSSLAMDSANRKPEQQVSSECTRNACVVRSFEENEKQCVGYQMTEPAALKTTSSAIDVSSKGVLPQETRYDTTTNCDIREDEEMKDSNNEDAFSVHEWDGSDVTTLPYESDKETLDLEDFTDQNLDDMQDVEKKPSSLSKIEKTDGKCTVDVPEVSPHWKITKFFEESNIEQTVAPCKDIKEASPVKSNPEKREESAMSQCQSSLSFSDAKVRDQTVSIGVEGKLPKLSIRRKSKGSEFEIISDETATASNKTEKQKCQDLKTPVSDDLVGSILSGMNSARFKSPPCTKTLNAAQRELPKSTNSGQSSRSIMLKSSHGSETISKAITDPRKSASSNVSRSAIIERMAPSCHTNNKQSEASKEPKQKKFNDKLTKESSKLALEVKNKSNKKKDRGMEKNLNICAKNSSSSSNKVVDKPTSSFAKETKKNPKPTESKLMTIRKANQAKPKNVFNEPSTAGADKECLKLPKQKKASFDSGACASKWTNILKRKSGWTEEYRPLGKEQKNKIRWLAPEVGNAVTANTKKSLLITNEYKCKICKTLFRQDKNEELCIRCQKRRSSTENSDNEGTDISQKKANFKSMADDEVPSKKCKTGFSSPEKKFPAHERKCEQLRFSKEKIDGGLLKLTFPDDDDDEDDYTSFMEIKTPLTCESAALPRNDSEDSLPDLLNLSAAKNIASPTDIKNGMSVRSMPIIEDSWFLNPEPVVGLVDQPENKIEILEVYSLKDFEPNDSLSGKLSPIGKSLGSNVTCPIIIDDCKDKPLTTTKNEHANSIQSDTNDSFKQEKQEIVALLESGKDKDTFDSTKLQASQKDLDYSSILRKTSGDINVGGTTFALSDPEFHYKLNTFMTSVFNIQSTFPNENPEQISKAVNYALEMVTIFNKGPSSEDKKELKLSASSLSDKPKLLKKEESDTPTLCQLQKSDPLVPQISVANLSSSIQEAQTTLEHNYVQRMQALPSEPTAGSGLGNLHEILPSHPPLVTNNPSVLSEVAVTSLARLNGMVQRMEPQTSMPSASVPQMGNFHQSLSVSSNNSLLPSKAKNIMPVLNSVQQLPSVPTSISVLENPRQDSLPVGEKISSNLFRSSPSDLGISFSSTDTTQVEFAKTNAVDKNLMSNKSTRAADHSDTMTVKTLLRKRLTTSQSRATCDTTSYSSNSVVQEPTHPAPASFVSSTFVPPSTIPTSSPSQMTNVTVQPRTSVGISGQSSAFNSMSSVAREQATARYWGTQPFSAQASSSASSTSPSVVVQHYPSASRCLQNLSTTSSSASTALVVQSVVPTSFTENRSQLHGPGQPIIVHCSAAGPSGQTSKNVQPTSYTSLNSYSYSTPSVNVPRFQQISSRALSNSYSGIRTVQTEKTASVRTGMMAVQPMPDQSSYPTQHQQSQYPTVPAPPASNHASQMIHSNGIWQPQSSSVLPYPQQANRTTVASSASRNYSAMPMWHQPQAMACCCCGKNATMQCHGCSKKLYCSNSCLKNHWIAGHCYECC